MKNAKKNDVFTKNFLNRSDMILVKFLIKSIKKIMKNRSGHRSKN